MSEINLIRIYFSLKTIKGRWGPSRIQVWHVSLNHVPIDNFKSLASPVNSRKRAEAFAQKLANAIKGEVQVFREPDMDVARANARLRTKGVLK
jgi:hypothetical protein